MIREVSTITRDQGRIQSLELSCGHSKALSSEALDKLAESAVRDRAKLTTDCTLCDPKPDKFPRMKPIPISVAKHIAEEYGYDQVVVYARRCGESDTPHGEHLTTYGRTVAHCDIAARMGDSMKRMMGWNSQRDQWVEREAIKLHIERDMTGRFWEALSAEERERYREEAGREWDQD